MGSRKFQSVLTGSIAVAALMAGAGSVSASVAGSGLSANLACSVAQMGVASAAQLNPLGTQGCVLPLVDNVPQAPLAEPSVDPAAVGTPQRAAGLPRGLIIAGALASGIAVAVLASRGSNGRVGVSG